MSVSIEQSYDIVFNGTDNEARFDLFIDSAADLSGLTYIDSVKIAQGSKSTDISTGDIYRMTSGGSWIRQPSDNQFANVYTKTEIDDIIDRIDALDTKQTLALVHLINENGKNRVKISATSQTINGITWTINSDGTVSASGTTGASSSYITLQVLAADYVFDGNYFLSGCPSGGSSSTYALYVARGSYTRYDYGDGTMLPSSSDGLNKNLIAIIYPNQTVTDIVFKPMICKKVYWDITQKFVPYCPTLPELYSIVVP